LNAIRAEVGLTIAVIGPGRLGSTLARVASDHGYRVSAIAGRKKAECERLAARLPNTKVCSIFDAPQGADLVLLTVSDDAIETVCLELAEKKAFSKGQIVAHCSGALRSDLLRSARDLCDAKIGSAHPLQSFSTYESAINKMPGTYWFCEGDPEALLFLKQFIETIGGLAREISPDKKVFYHCASAIASNYLVSILDVALNIAELAGLERHISWQALKPIIEATVDNVDKLGTVDALTGPIARGDSRTIGKHLSALSNDRDLAQVYRAMGEWTVGLAEKKGLSKPAADSIRKSLKKLTN
jgi:predicted short-subunit dehydrogenase-like oxidoreductase (DUF2520 family)